MKPIIPYMPPVYSFEPFLNIFREPALELRRNIQAPDPMIGLALIAAASVATQGLVDVLLPSGQCRPTSLNFLIIAESGERKSTLDSLVFSSIYAHDEKMLEAFHVAMKKYQEEEGDWKDEGKLLRYKRAKAEGDEDKEQEIIKLLVEHKARKPVKPRMRRMVRQNITERALMEALEGDGESIMLATDEGEVLFKGGAMTKLGLLNKAYDGARSLSLDRADGEHLMVMNPRVSVNIMTQRAVFKEYLSKHGDVARGSGHWARYLVAWPNSTQGYRFVWNHNPEWVALPVFQARVSELLDRCAERTHIGEVKRQMLEFSEEAKVRWFDLSRQTEQMLRPGGYLNDIHDFASKAMEILGRLSAVFHYFNGEDGKISLDTLNRAFEFVRWHVDEFKRLFSEEFEIPPAQADAQKLVDYLLKRALLEAHGETRCIKKTTLLNRGPVRNRDRLNAALDYLAEQWAIWVWPHPSTKVRYVCLYNNYFNALL